MPSSACLPWQTDKPASPAGERNDQLRSYTTSGDTIELTANAKSFSRSVRIEFQSINVLGPEDPTPDQQRACWRCSSIRLQHRGQHLCGHPDLTAASTERRRRAESLPRASLAGCPAFD